MKKNIPERDRVEIKNPNPEAQNVFDELQQKKRDIGSYKRARRESLENIPNYTKTKDDIKRLRDQKKNLELDFDNKEPSFKNRIEALTDHVDALNAKLTGIALEHYKKTGTMLEVRKELRSGKEKKVRFGFSARQLSMF